MKDSSLNSGTIASYTKKKTQFFNSNDGSSVIEIPAAVVVKEEIDLFESVNQDLRPGVS